MMIDISLDIAHLDGIVRVWLKDTLQTVQHNAAHSYVHPEDAKQYQKDIKALKRLLAYVRED